MAVPYTTVCGGESITRTAGAAHVQGTNLAGSVPECVTARARTGIHLPGQRHQVAGHGRVVRPVCGAAAQHGEPDGLQTRDFHHRAGARSEEHTSELQALMRTTYAVFRLKKKIDVNRFTTPITTICMIIMQYTFKYLNIHATITNY